jgi:hypothetical protein
MRKPLMARLGIVTIAVVAALSLGALGVASSADATIISACYKRSSGVVRILRGVQRCRRHEVRISWNTQGPAGKNGVAGRNGASGKNGTNGTNGKNGANGAAAGYFATQAGSLNITAAPGHVLTKALPAGDYLVSAKVEVTATAKAAGAVQAECKLVLATGTGESVIDSSGWAASLISFAEPEFLAAAAVPLDGAVNLTTAGSVVVVCETLHGEAKEEVVSTSAGQLVAVQTASNS